MFLGKISLPLKVFFVTTLLSLVITFAMYNIYPFYIDRPWSRTNIQPNAFVLKTLLLFNALLMGIVLYGVYGFPYLTLFLGSFSIRDKIMFFITILYIVWLFTPSIILVFYLWKYVYPYEYLTFKEALSIYNGYSIAHNLYIAEIAFNAPLILLIYVLLMKSRHSLKIGLKSLMLYLFIVFIVNQLIAVVSIFLQMIIDITVLSTCGLQGFFIYLRGWHPETLDIIKETNNPGMTLIPSWGAFVSPIPWAVLSYLLLKYAISRVIKK